MAEFIELDIVVPIVEGNGKLVAMQRKSVFVNADNISYFEPIEIAHPVKKNYYEFYKHISDREILADQYFWQQDEFTVLDIKFESIPNHKSVFMSAFKELDFISGFKIYFKSGLSPRNNDEPVYTITLSRFIV